MKTIKKIEIQFENCEVISLKPSDFENLLIEDIKTHVRRFACNAIGKSSYGEIQFTLFKGANREHSIFGSQRDITTVFDRITNYDDITHIYLTYEDGTEESISAIWLGDSEYENEAQHSRITDRGDLKVYIGERFVNSTSHSTSKLVDKYWMDEDDKEMEFRENFFKED